MRRLNTKQAEAVKNIGNPLLVLAGAGSGKTSVITEKIAYLLRDCEYDPANVIAVTFTNKAAREMRERITKMLGEEYTTGLTVSTFHTLGLKIIHSELRNLPYQRGFTIYDSEDSISLVKEVLRIEKVSPDFADQFRWQISTWKNAMVSHEQALEMAENDLQAQAARIYKAYDDYLKVYNAVDFDDLIVVPVRLFQENPEAMERWQNKTRYLLVDEYQDTNACQYTLVKQLVGIRGAFTVVGDDDQSIYAWRGAQPENLRLLVSDFPSLQVVKLEQNYRSLGRILKVANHIIANNDHIFDKKLWSDKGYGDPLKVVACDDPDHEAQKVVTEMLHKKFIEQASFNDFAVLFRGNHQVRTFEKAMRAHRIPYKVSGSFSFFSLAEIKDLMCYMRLVVNPLDDAAFLRVINTPRREIGAKTVELLRNFADKKMVSLHQAVIEHDVSNILPARSAVRIVEFAQWLKDISARSKTEAGDKILKDIIRDVGYESYLTDSCKDIVSARKRMENIKDLIDWVKNIEGENGEKTLDHQIAHLSLLDLLEKNEDEEESDKVQLITLHSSKGLEFPHVYMVGMEEELLPHVASMDEDGIEEERRLAYVGITRAQKTLTMSFSKRRRVGAEIVERKPSRFLLEMPQDELEWEGYNEKKDPEKVKERGKAHLANLRNILS